MSDRQLVAFAGEPNGKITLIDWRKPAGFNHRVIREAGDHSWITESVGDIDADPKLWEDALKVSGCFNLTVQAGHIKGGNEDVLDVMRSKHVKIKISTAEPRGRFVTTQKGSSFDVVVRIGCQIGNGREVDHDYGNKADNDNDYTSSCNLVIISQTSRVVIRVLRATRPDVMCSNYRFAFPKPDTWYHPLCVWFLNKFQ